MKKRQTHFEKVSEYSDRFKNLSLEQLRKKQNTGYHLIKEAAIAVRELIEEKERKLKDDHEHNQDSEDKQRHSDVF